MKKTLISIFLVAVMVLTFIIPASAAPGSLSANATFSGTTFTVNLVVENNPGVISMTAKAAYDPSVLTLKSAKNGEIFESIFTPSETLEDNPYTIIWMDATASEDITTNGVLASYTFEVKKDAKVEQTEIKFNIAEAVNVDVKDAEGFKACTYTVDLKNMKGESKTDAELSVSSNDKTGTASEDTASKVENDKAGDNSDSNKLEVEDNTPEKADRTLVTILTIVAIVVLGGAVTAVAVISRKKSAKGKDK